MNEEISPRHSRMKIKNNLSKLLEDTPESYYWIGFILADGCIHNNRLKISISKKDVDLLIDFCTYLEIDPNRINTYSVDGKFHYVSMAIKDRNVIPLIQKKYQINNRKTYNPPVVMYDLSDNLISLYVGFIDGDGYIAKLHKRADCQITIKRHSSWQKFLTQLRQDLYEYFDCKKFQIDNGSIINSKGYAYVAISNNELLKKIKLFILDKKLPVLKRKWDVIDLNITNKYERSDVFKKKVCKMYKSGLRVVDIARITKHKYTTVYQAIHRQKEVCNES